MKIFVKLLILFCLSFGNLFANAETIKILVLPVDLFSVCQNYYCFEEPSEIFANDIIEKFNYSNKIETVDLYKIRKNITENVSLKSAFNEVSNKYKKDNQIDFKNLKNISQHFETNFVLIISSSINQNNLNRNLWEVLEVSSAFEIYKNYNLTTNPVLIDCGNDLILWSSKYERSLSDNEKRFWARDIASAVSQLEKIKNYSKKYLSPVVVANVINRFYSKTTELNAQKKVPKTNVTDFKPNAMKFFDKKLNNNFKEIETEPIFSF